MWTRISGWVARQIGRGLVWALKHPENVAQAAKVGKAIVDAVKDGKAK